MSEDPLALPGPDFLEHVEKRFRREINDAVQDWSRCANLLAPWENEYLRDDLEPRSLAAHKQAVERLLRFGRLLSVTVEQPDFADSTLAQMVATTQNNLQDKLAHWHSRAQAKEQRNVIPKTSVPEPPEKTAIHAVLTPIEIIETARAQEWIDEDGHKIEVTLRPPLTDADLDAFARQLPCPIPEHIRDLLKYCTGFEGTLDQLDFTGRSLQFQQPELFPHGLPIAHDGMGNYWVVDLKPQSTDWAPIYFYGQDPPVVLLQSPSLTQFVDETFRMLTPSYESLIDGVHEDRLYEVWKYNPGVINQAQAAASSDPVLREFAGQLSPEWQIIDLRQARIGMGFSWGRYGPNTQVRRHGLEPIFAYQPKSGFLGRLFR